MTDREFFVRISRHLRAFAESLADKDQRGQMLGIVAAIEAKIEQIDRENQIVRRAA